MSRTLWELQKAPVNRMRAAYEAHFQPGLPLQAQFSAAKARTIHAMERELEAARSVGIERFTSGYKAQT